MSSAYSEDVYRIWLAECLGAGSDYLTAVTEFGGARAFYEVSEIEWRMLGVFRPTQIARLSKRDLSTAGRSAQICAANSWHIIPQDSADYPVHLGMIKDAPALLYANGDKDCLKEKLCISIVGAREASLYGKEVAFRLAASLVRAGVTVISGGALGIDSASHEGAISAGGKTIAVMGCGLGASYLPENEALRNSVSKNGAVISEYLPLSKPTRASFPMRNRIISGMSLMTVVVEASERSGSLGTARHAVSQGRDVGAVPGDVISSAFVGSNFLLSQGAKHIASAADVLEDYVYTYPELINLSKVERTLERKAAEEPVKKRAPDNLTRRQADVYELFGSEPMSFDLLVTKSGLDAPALSLTLTELELEGLITECAGNRYKIV